MTPRPLGRTGLHVSPVGFGAFKIGRNVGIKYRDGYELPDDDDVAQLLNGVLDLGVNLIDTAPAYGTSEERIGRAIVGRRAEYILSTKVGEEFSVGPDGEPRSEYKFDRASITASVERSLRRLKTDAVDVLLLHSDGRDLYILNNTDAVETLESLKAAGKARAIGLSGKTAAGHRDALDWADVLMVEYHADDESQAGVIATAASRGVGVLVKKGLAAGRLPAGPALDFVLGHPGVSSCVVGGLSLRNVVANVVTAGRTRLRDAA